MPSNPEEAPCPICKGKKRRYDPICDPCLNYAGQYVRAVKKGRVKSTLQDLKFREPPKEEPVEEPKAVE